MPFDGTTYKHDEVLDVLRRARERVARPGMWCQGHLHIAHTGASCAMGNVDRVTGFPARHNSAVLQLLTISLPRGFDGGLVAYNDAPDRTQAEIVALFDRAIAKREMSNAG